MEFLVISTVILIYVIIMGEVILGGCEKRKKATSYSCQGHEHYKTIGVTNMLIGMIGLIFFNYFLRDKGIIPVWSFWVGFAGFAILIMIGIINIAKMFCARK